MNGNNSLDSYAIAEQLSGVIAEDLQNKPQCLVGLCGAADLGKSHLAQQLVQALASRGIQAGHLTLDSFLMDRARRIEKRISGYDIASYQVEAAQQALVDFQQGKPVVYFPYNHSEGKVGSHAEAIKGCSVLLLDGVQAMHPAFATYLDSSIFIATDDEQLKAIRHQANLVKRGQTEAFSRASAEPEFQAYQHHIAPYAQQASYRVRLLTRWRYSFERAGFG